MSHDSKFDDVSKIGTSSPSRSMAVLVSRGTPSELNNRERAIDCRAHAANATQLTWHRLKLRTGLGIRGVVGDWGTGTGTVGERDGKTMLPPWTPFPSQDSTRLSPICFVFVAPEPSSSHRARECGPAQCRQFHHRRRQCCRDANNDLIVHPLGSAQPRSSSLAVAKPKRRPFLSSKRPQFVRLPANLAAQVLNPDDRNATYDPDTLRPCARLRNRSHHFQWLHYAIHLHRPIVKTATPPGRGALGAGRLSGARRLWHRLQGEMCRRCAAKGACRQGDQQERRGWGAD